MSTRPFRRFALIAACFPLLVSAARSDGDKAEKSPWVESSKEEPAKTPYHTFHSEEVGGKVSYLIYFPPGYDDHEDRHYPVIYWLHGMTHDQREGGDFVRRLDRAIRSGDAPPAIAVLVNGRSHSFYCDSPHGKEPVESMIVKDLIPHIDDTYRTKAKGRDRAVEGYSMGGFGAAHLGFKFPEKFGVVSILAGSIDKPEKFAEDKSDELSQAFGGDQDYFEKNSPWTLVEKNADAIRKDQRIRIVVGDEDPFYTGLKGFHERLKRLDIESTFRVIDGVTHDYKKLYEKLDDHAFEIYRKAWGESGDR